MSSITDWLALILVPGALLWAATTARRAPRLLHMLQLEEYETDRLARWLVAEGGRLAPASSALLVTLAGVGLGLRAAGDLTGGSAAALGLLAGAAAIVVLFRQRTEPAKKPLRPTPKLLVVSALAGAFWLAVALLPWLTIGSWLGGGTLGLGLAALLGVALAEALLPAEVLLGNLVLLPVQWAAKEAIIQAATAKLARSRVKVIGITGSYGKTSTKEILATILAGRFKVLKTPASFNTPLGIARVILRQLRSEHEILVVEMGAYRRGDIRHLCSIARPEIGILTAVSPQHLERFKSIENIAAAKYELIEAVANNSKPGATRMAIFNNDNAWCRQLAAKTTIRTLRYGLEEAPTGGSAPDVTARQVRVTRAGLELTLEAVGAGSAAAKVTLLGRHNASNVLAATAAALACGMTIEDIARAAANVQPVEHRLQLIPSSGGVTVIDDAYNANPDGARAALEVLREFGGARKVLVTPGMVELGEREAAENQAFGERAAAVCDTVILVGPKRTAPIRVGLAAAGFPDERVIVVRGIAEVPALLQRLVGPGDVVLFENDLPDNYSE